MASNTIPDTIETLLIALLLLRISLKNDEANAKPKNQSTEKSEAPKPNASLRLADSNLAE